MKKIVVLVFVLFLAACGAEATDDAAPAPSESSPGKTPRPVHSPNVDLPYQGGWMLVSGTSPDGPIPIFEDHRVTLELRGRHAKGHATCNGYGGRFWITGNLFTHVPVSFAANQMGCGKDLDGAEERFFTSMMLVDHVDVERETLRLTGPDVELVFERVPVIDKKALVNRTWAAGDHTMRLSRDNGFEITYGCRVVTGEWVQRAGRIYFPEAKVTKDCPNPSGRVAADVTSGNFTVSIQGDVMTIEQEGKKVVYTAR